MHKQTHLDMFAAAYRLMQTLGERIKGRKYSASELTNIIRRQFSATDFVFKTARDYAVDPDMAVVAGLYDCYDDSQMLPSMTITMCYHPEQETFFVDLINWQQLSFDIAECIGHELVHRDQWRNKRKPALMSYNSDDEEKAYLGSEDEIEAYGFSIAAESVIFKKPKEHCVMYNVYLETFDTDPSVILKLQHQVTAYTNKLEQLYEQANN